MNEPRRTFLKGLAAIGGVFGLCAAKQQPVIADEIDCPCPGEIAAIQKRFQDEMNSRRLPPGEWHIVARRGQWQHRVVVVFFDRILNADLGSTKVVCETCSVAVDLRGFGLIDDEPSKRSAIKSGTDYALRHMRTANLFETDEPALGVVTCRGGGVVFEELNP